MIDSVFSSSLMDVKSVAVAGSDVGICEPIDSDVLGAYKLNNSMEKVNESDSSFSAKGELPIKYEMPRLR